jgi:hypothetical protein
MTTGAALSHRQKRRRFAIGLSYLMAGAGAFSAMLILRPPTDSFDWSSVVFFGIAFLVLELKAVEVNDRWKMSSGVMPLFTGGVVFALQSGRALAGMMLIGAAGLLGPGDLRRRRVFLPASNFGQIAVSSAVAGLVLDRLLQNLAGKELSEAQMLQIAIAGSVAALVYTVFNLGLVRMAVSTVYGSANLLPWSRMSSLAFAQVLMGFLGGMLGALLLLSAPSESDTPAGSPLIPLVLGVYVIGHLVYTSYSKLRQAHEDSLRGFVKTLETRDLYTRGHTERVAEFCRLIGEELGFTGTQMERMRWAALIHDMGKLAVPAELLSKQGALSDDEYRLLRQHSHRVDDLLSEVDFLEPMVDITSGCHPRLEHEDFGQTHHAHTAVPTLEQRVLAVADAFDAMTSSRTYRMSMPQSAAFDALLDNDSLLYDRDVVEALRRAITSSGRVFGQPTLGQWERTELTEIRHG